MTPRPATAEKEKIQSETRQRLLQAAAKEFAEKGFVGANINQISIEAGFAKGTIYNYFPSKRELMLALIDEVGANQTAFISALVDTENDPTLRLNCFFRAGYGFYYQFPNQMQVVISVLYGHDEEFKSRFFEAYEELINLIIEDIIGVGIGMGEFKESDPDHTGAMILSLYLGSLSIFNPQGKSWSDPDDAVSFILNGIKQGKGRKEDQE